MIKRRKKTKEQIAKNNLEVSAMFNFFISLWALKPHYSEISGAYLGKLPLSTFFHHILPKSKYPEAKYDKDNLIFVTFEEHQSVESNIYKYEIINEKRKKLLIKYE